MKACRADQRWRGPPPRESLTAAWPTPLRPALHLHFSGLDLLEFRAGLFELDVEQPHRVEDFAEACGGSRPLGLSKRKDAIVAQIFHDSRVGDAIAEQVAGLQCGS